jgi:lipopolysaccharide/colanic/teichoic acid biosynthesis glycosyltransferase
MMGALSIESGGSAVILDPEAVPLTLWKRPLDLFIAGSLVLLFAPLMACLALALWLDSGAPVLYRQDRVGRFGAPFKILKFRSMRARADESQHRRLAAEWFAGSDSTRGYKSHPDPRVTRVGRFLRRTNLDELPQLFNVLRGDMSIVGPRPAIMYEIEHYRHWYFERQRVLPGITGLWQVRRRDRLAAREMMALDVEYVRTCSFALDVKILLSTWPALLRDWLEGPRTLQL